MGWEGRGGEKWRGAYCWDVQGLRRREVFEGEEENGGRVRFRKLKRQIKEKFPCVEGRPEAAVGREA